MGVPDYVTLNPARYSSLIRDNSPSLKTTWRGFIILGLVILFILTIVTAVYGIVVASKARNNKHYTITKGMRDALFGLSITLIVVVSIVLLPLIFKRGFDLARTARYHNGATYFESNKSNNSTMRNIHEKGAYTPDATGLNAGDTDHVASDVNRTIDIHGGEQDDPHEDEIELVRPTREVPTPVRRPLPSPPRRESGSSDVDQTTRRKFKRLLADNGNTDRLVKNDKLIHCLTSSNALSNGN